MSCAWAKIEQTQPVNLQQIISEDLARARESKRLDDYLVKQENESLDHETETVNDNIDLNSVNADDSEIDDSFEEVDEIKFEKILNEYDPIPNRKTASNNAMKYKKPRATDKRDDTDCKSQAHSYDYSFFNKYTKNLLSKLFDKNIINKINGVLHKGTKSIILHGTTFNGKECAIKVFQFSTQTESKNSLALRKTFENLAQQEMNILLRLDKIGVRAPKFISLEEYIVVMSFIGDSGLSAETLETAALSAKDYKKAYAQTIEGIKKCGKEKIAHGDLSAQSILWYNNRCHFIDVCESVDLKDGYCHLQRGCKKVIEFFKGKKVPYITTAERLFSTIWESYIADTSNRVTYIEVLDLYVYH